jgi:hypothetical protein
MAMSGTHSCTGLANTIYCGIHLGQTIQDFVNNGEGVPILAPLIFVRIMRICFIPVRALRALPPFGSRVATSLRLRDRHIARRPAPRALRATPDLLSDPRVGTRSCCSTACCSSAT